MNEYDNNNFIKTRKVVHCFILVIRSWFYGYNHGVLKIVDLENSESTEKSSLLLRKFRREIKDVVDRSQLPLTSYDSLISSSLLDVDQVCPER